MPDLAKEDHNAGSVNMEYSYNDSREIEPSAENIL
jgi:hypothetical protein